MRNLLFIWVLGMTLYSNAQTAKELQKEIDVQVWRPFKNAFETLDGEALNATYAAQVLRATPDGLDTKSAFKPKNLERFKKNKKDGISIALDFWFDSRRTKSDTSYEVGFYRIGFTDKNGNTDYVYGQFHIVLKKIDGLWKITQDWDTTTINGKVISEEDFDKQKPAKF